LPVEQHLALDAVQPEERGQQVALPLSLQAAQSQNLAAVQVKIDVLKAMTRAEIADGKHHRLRHQLLDRRLGREDIGNLAADHELDQLVGRRSLSGHRGDVFAVLEHRDPVGDREDLLQPVRDEDHRHPPVAQHAQRGKEEFHLALVECGSGFVQNEELRLGDECLGEFDKLSLGERKLSCMRPGIDVDPKVAKNPGRFGFDTWIVDLSQPRPWHPAEEDVLRHAQVWAETQLLVNGGNADRFGLVRREPGKRGAIELDRAGIRLMHAGDQIDPGAFAGAVFAHEGVNLTRIDIEAHPVEHHIAGERLRQVGRTQDGRGVEWRHLRPGGANGGPGGHDSLDT
jgi:hypothetical protein